MSTRLKFSSKMRLKLKIKYFFKSNQSCIFNFSKRIDVSNNDFPWYLHVDRVPSLLFIPSLARSSLINLRDTINYDFTDVDQIDAKHLTKFILYNAKNPNTLLTFLKENFLNRKKYQQEDDHDLSKSSKLRYDLINLVSTKQKVLETEINKLDHMIRNHTSSYVEFSAGDEIEREYLQNLDYYLRFKLDSFNLELDVLRNFTTLFN